MTKNSPKEYTSTKSEAQKLVSPLMFIKRLLITGLVMLSMTVMFMISPALSFFFAGIWGISLSWNLRKSMRSELDETRTQWIEREAYLQDRIEVLSDQIFVLQDRESRYRGLIEKQSDILFRRDRDGSIAFANDAFYATFGVHRGDVLGKTFNFEILQGELPDVVTNRAARLSYDVCLKTALGVKWFAFEDFAILDERGGLFEVQYVGRDVTERHEVQENLRQARIEAEAAAVAKSRFLATMSHEIRTPLNGVLGMASLLQKTQLSQEQAAYISAISTSGEALLTLVDDVLDFSRLEAGKVRLENKAFELSSLCEEVVELLAPRAHAKALELALCVSPQAQGTFEGDANRLRQILLNLIGNSVKFTDTGGVKVEVTASKTVAGHVEISVSDTGPGIPLAAQEQIFREFEQVEQGPARKYGGSGLGLAISAKLARLMGGDLRLDHSETGKGARFVASLPLQSIKTVEAVAKRPPNGKRALIWTSLVHESAMWAKLLEAHGYEIHVFAGFDAEPDSADLAKAEIVIFDNYVLGKYRNVLDRLQARRIVALTPEERQGVLPRQADLPLDGFLIRPVRQEALALVSRAQRFAEQKAHGFKKNAMQDFTGISVLVAEDNDINALLTEKILESLGAHVMRVSDGLEVIEAISLQRFDLVFMDVHMPMMDGLEASRHLHEERQTGIAHPPVIALTANSSVEDREKCLAAGMSDFLVKPVSQDHIAKMLEKWLPTREASIKGAEAL